MPDVERTSRGFKEFILGLMKKRVVDWLNTLSLKELAGLLME
jgi:hypothetical protein